MPGALPGSAASLPRIHADCRTTAIGRHMNKEAPRIRKDPAGLHTHVPDDPVDRPAERYACFLPNFALNRPMNVGTSDTARISTITNSK